LQDCQDLHRKRVLIYIVATVDEIPPGQRKLVEVAGRSIGVFNLAGEYFALRNTCPHQGGPLCSGRLTGHNITLCAWRIYLGHVGEILACPWHGWEFDLRTGACLVDKRKLRLFPVEVEAGTIYVRLRARAEDGA